MSGVRPDTLPDAGGNRLLPRVTLVPYLLLAVLACWTVLEKYSETRSMLIDLALCALAAAWELWMVTLHPTWWTRPKAMTVFVVGLIAITAVLVIRDPWFGFFTPAGYFYSFRLLPWPWTLAGVTAVAMEAGTAQSAAVVKTTPAGMAAYCAIMVVNVLPLCGLAWFESNRTRDTIQREQALAEVREANSRLESTLTENAGLHHQLMVQAREAGILDERQRMAREIHDTLAQGLIGIITQLQAAECAEHDPARWRGHLAAATGLARESLSEARRSVHELRPEPLETARHNATVRLSTALGGVAERWSALHGIPVEVTTTGTMHPTPPETEVALLRAAQEAFANVARHAQATRVGLTLSYLEHEVVLDVRDDGRGFDLAQLDDTVPADPATDRSHGGGSGFGLVAMRQRIECLSGTLQVESEPGLGTGISAHIPVQAGAAR
jgi:signal transduction histidine kinase